MENDIYYVKLVSGEDIIGYIEDPDTDDNMLIIEEPMLVQYFPGDEGTNSSYQAGIRPWIPGMFDKNEFPLFKEHMMFIARVESDNLIDFYEKVVERNQEEGFEHVIHDEFEEDDEYNAEIDDYEIYSSNIH